MTVLRRYLDELGRAEGDPADRAFDELAAGDGTVRQGWSQLVDGLEDLGSTELRHAQREVERLLADDGVIYTPGPLAGASVVGPTESPGAVDELSEPRPWKLDPLPLMMDEREWSGLEAGLVQRSELLNAILTDLYDGQQLLAQGLIPPAAVLDHDEFLRAVVGTGRPDAAGVEAARLFMVAVDLGRDATGRWKVISDRTQAPSGAGYAMQNRRVVSRVLPEVYHEAHLHRLTPFFQTMRSALVDAAPQQVEDPRVVVLSPGTHSETAFDQAFLASLLGFPLLEGSDLTVRDGRVWMRVLGKLEQVDVILRRVDSVWMDALELKAGSRLGVTGLLECVRQGTVSVVNAIGSGILENPALLPFLPQLCERLLSQPLRLPSVDTWWCGDPESRRYVSDHLDELVIRPISRAAGRSVRGSALTSGQQDELRAKIDAAPHRFVGQEVLNLSSAPTAVDDGLARRQVVLRSFAVRAGGSYTAMLGGLARVNDDAEEDRGVLVTAPGGGLAKDVWVVSNRPVVAARPTTARSVRGDDEPLLPAVDAASAAMVPRVLSDLFWFGRYAERAEDLLRLILATRTVAIETDLDTTAGHALEVLLQAVTHVSTSYPGFTAPGVAMMGEFRSLLLDRQRRGSAAQAVASLSMAAQGVRDQLSDDVWMVLADVDRALAALAVNPYDQGLQLTDASERVLSGLLALAGIVSENMVRDAGWYSLDVGRGLERALQTVSLLLVTVCEQRAPETDRLVMEAALSAAESIVTFRRRNRGRSPSHSGVDAVVDLLVTDQRNPRSVAYQLQRVATDLRAIPDTSPTARPLRLADALQDRLRTAVPAELARPSDGHRLALADFLRDVQAELRALAESIRDQYHRRPLDPQTWRQSWNNS